MRPHAIPNLIRRIRASLKFTQQDLANHLHVHVSTVAKWEQGRVRPRPHFLEAIKKLEARL